MTLTTITTWLGTIPPIVIAVLIGAAYSLSVAGRWTWPMLLDGALLVLYIARPSLPLLLWSLLFGCVRHTPALAREVAVLCRLQAFDGWTLHVALFVLPALQCYTVKSVPTSPPSMPEMKPTSAPTAPPIEDLPLLASEWLHALNSDPTAPHVGVVGATRLGKTTFVGVLLAYRQGDFVITTPKAAQYDPWFGAEVARPVIAADEMSYAPIERAVTQVYQEMLHRNAPGGSATPAITLVIDEWPQVVGELPSLAKKVINLLRMGAGCGIRLILMATDVNVRGWKMDGSAGVLDNLVFARVEGDRQWSIGRLDPNWRVVSPRRLDTALVWGHAQRVSLAGRGWAGVRRPAADPLLGGLLARVEGMGGGLLAPTPGVQTHTHTHTNEAAERRIAMYVDWRRIGIKKEQARALRHTSSDGLDDTEWAEAGKRLANGPD